MIAGWQCGMQMASRFSLVVMVALFDMSFSVTVMVVSIFFVTGMISMVIAMDFE